MILGSSVDGLASRAAPSDLVVQPAAPDACSSRLMDAFERRDYGSYLWSSRQDKKYWEVPPTSCELVPSLRAKHYCKSREEFDAFVADYMEE